MATIINKNSIVKTYTGLRNENLLRNNGGYSLYDGNLNNSIGSSYDFNYNENNKPASIKYKNIVSYTYNGEDEYSKNLNEQYGRDIDSLGIYSVQQVKPSFKVNDYDGFGDYLSYFEDIYGREENYLGYLSGLLGIRDDIENLSYDIVPDAKGKTFDDYINDIMQYADIKYALERQSVGIVKDIKVAPALGGVITTNINNHSDKDTRLGTLTNRLYALSLLRGAHFNSIRKTKYITEDLSKLYGNNLSNVYNLSSLFSIDEGTGRFPDMENGEYIETIDTTVSDYLSTKIDNFQLPQGEGPWSKGYSDKSKYFDLFETDGDDIVEKWGVKDDVFLYDDEFETDAHYDEGRWNGESNTTTVTKLEVGTNNILQKTNELLSKRKIKTLMGEFQTDPKEEKGFGISRGRNLLSKKAWEDGQSIKVNGYDNPFCRVWTYHNQYSKMYNLIRPFTNTEEGGQTSFVGVDELQQKWNVFRNYEGPERLNKYGVINKNGMVNITPTNEVDIKQCMFSIENLAWRDILTEGNTAKYRIKDGETIDDYQEVLSKEQQGPNGGRIMWFPPYDIEFTENVNVKWDTRDFIGRGEPVYTYVNTKRSGTLSFTMLVDNPAILNYWMLDKKSDSDINDEQTALRYFAGCEKIDPDDTIANLLLNGTYEGGNSNVSGSLPEKDVIFYTFFPNMFSGEDNDANKSLDILFGGHGKDGNRIKINTSGETSEDGSEENAPFLGYEMGTSPISAYFKKEINDDTENWVIDKVVDSYDIRDEYQSNTFIEGGPTLEWGHFQNSGNSELYYTISNFNFIKNTSKVNKTGISKNNEKIDTLESEINRLAGTITKGDSGITASGFTLPNKNINSVDDLGSYASDSEMGILKSEIVPLMDMNKKTDLYNTKVKDLKSKSDEVKNKVESINRLLSDNFKRNADEQGVGSESGNLGKINRVKEFLTGNTTYIRTNSLYFYYSGDTDNSKGLVKFDKIEENGETNVLATMQMVVANYLKYNLPQQYDTEEKARKDFVSDKTDFNVCYVKQGGKYFALSANTATTLSDTNIVWETVANKKELVKDSKTLGKLSRGSNSFIYLVKTTDDEVLEFKNIEDAATVAKQNALLPVYDTLEEFRDSVDTLCLIGENFGYKTFVEVSGTNVIDKIKESFPNDITEMYEQYFYGYIYHSFDNVQRDKKFGVIVIHYIMTTEDSTNNNFQEFIVTSNRDYNSTEEVENVDNTENNTNIESDIIKCYKGSSFEENRLYKLTSGFKTGTTVQYPVDNVNTNEALTDIQKVDIKSFGLNSTYEIVKEVMNDATCSFGEFYAGINDDKPEYKEFVLDCEKAVLDLIITEEDAEKKQSDIKAKISEAEARIDNISLLFGTKSQTNTEINTDKSAWNLSAKIKGGSSDVKNGGVDKKRAETLQKYLEDKIAELKGKSVVEESGSANEPTDISSKDSKKGRYARSKIVIGADDELQKSINDKKENDEDLTKEELESEMRRYKRYDNEKLFFEMLQENDSVAYKRLVDKVKYFSPAFHSTTPEGFNARLTFLHQCTRQGPTVTSSDISGSTTASNLAFGRAPFCILRLGDFLNTKIAINSISINYPDNQWDINPDGIGMQYMMAKVQMNIDIIGGSDISAPIKRLQNAVTFNYYANTSIYDNRSDIARYDGNGGIMNVRQWNPKDKQIQHKEIQSKMTENGKNN